MSQGRQTALTTTSCHRPNKMELKESLCLCTGASGAKWGLRGTHDAAWRAGWPMQGFKTLAHLGWCLNPRRQRVEGNSIILLLLPCPSSSGQGSENHRAASRAATTQAMALGTV